VYSRMTRTCRLPFALLQRMSHNTCKCRIAPTPAHMLSVWVGHVTNEVIDLHLPSHSSPARHPRPPPYCLVGGQGLHPSANDSFRASNDLESIVQRYYGRRGEAPKPGLHRSSSVGLSVMTPVKPMLAEAVKTVEVRSWPSQPHPPRFMSCVLYQFVRECSSPLFIAAQRHWGTTGARQRDGCIGVDAVSPAHMCM
jgi:hypothetical protein